VSEGTGTAPVRGLRRMADAIMGALMALMFGVFILQIVTRYLAKYQLGSGFIWTQDLSATCMVWIVFFGGAFALTETDHVKFDMVYNLFGDQAQRLMAIVTAVVIATFFAWSLPATLDSWLGQLYRWNKPNPTLKVPFTGKAVPMWWIYAVYVAFAAALVVRYAVRAVRLIMGATPAQLDPPAIPTEDRAA
jgi:C4-dicarboxylate transporter, DctQ subunit